MPAFGGKRITRKLMDKFILENPNKKLVSYGVALIIISATAFFIHALSILLSVAIIARIFVLLWMLGISRSVGRNAVAWTIISFVLPSPSLIFLGFLGYKHTPLFKETMEFYSQEYKLKYSKLKDLRAIGEISEEKMKQELANYYKEITELAKNKICGPLNNLNEAFLNSQLEKKGFVLHGEPEAVVEFKTTCPACGAKITADQAECPDCGLNLE
jgi:hypothetical protein